MRQLPGISHWTGRAAFSISIRNALVDIQGFHLVRGFPAHEAEPSGFRFTPWEVCCGRAQPIVSDKSANDQSLQDCQHHFRLLRLLQRNPPSKPGRFVQRCFRCRSIDLDEQRPMFKCRLLSSVASHDVFGMHYTEVQAAGSPYDICQPGVCVHQRCFHFESSFLFDHSMSVNDMAHLEACNLNFPDALQLVADISVGQLCTCMSEDAIAFSLANVKCLTISRIDQAVHVPLELLYDFRRKGLYLHLNQILKRTRFGRAHQ